MAERIRFASWLRSYDLVYHPDHDPARTWLAHFRASSLRHARRKVDEWKQGTEYVVDEVSLAPCSDDVWSKK